jgi:hypothetical protein
MQKTAAIALGQKYAWFGQKTSIPADPDSKPAWMVSAV